ncbi:glycine betaine ABC transporter substrate-binding protein [Nocardiopsis sp. EMB25]|uniref:glycine betaine ABC transporter substrate-binding protein n=1 Tax=Nocardiopsis sp. EMB25 TaxID=2835867 RepID=UPI002284E624|nr:glycine betaine ABC transporter substrate-binding protein [Nocardiopsis sp. EMB25]MCY9787002.1 glycine betaine ABC transporter substrate-binding protein [Nocardiopsis sp. EMB25]
MNARLASLTALGLGSALLLTACGGGGQDLTEGDGDDQAAGACEPGAEAPVVEETDIPVVDIPESGEDADEINIALIPWEEGIAATALWEVLLGEKGYDVTITELDVAPMYQGAANGDVDLFLDTWLPQTHADYWADYGSDLENLGYWYDNARLTLTVPSYMEDVNTIADLREHADELDGQIVGIESGSGLVRTTKEHAVPGYCLGDDLELVESSTGAMLAELDSAYQAEEPIVVTLWRPHIAYAQYDLKDLEDPEGMMGGAETIHAVGRGGFAEDYPNAASWLSEFTLSDEELGSLESLTLDEYEDDPQEGARVWLSENPEFLERTLGDDAEGLEF